MSSAGKLVPGRLWSLWELMHTLRADKFFKAYEQLAVLHQTLAVMPPGTRPTISKYTVDEYRENIASLTDDLTALGMTGAVAVISRGMEILNSAGEIQHGGIPHIILSQDQLPRLKTAFSQATSRIPDDLMGQTMLALDPRTKHLYEDPMCFGKDVFDQFEPANEDIAEAGKCLALDRATACVMHLNRVLEVGLAALAGSIQVGPQKDWGSYIREINDEIAKRAKAAGARSADEKFYAETNVIFDSMKRAYRNPTMHPEKRYSVEQAKDIFDTVRSFMRHLATRLSSSSTCAAQSP